EPTTSNKRRKVDGAVWTTLLDIATAYNAVDAEYVRLKGAATPAELAALRAMLQEFVDKAAATAEAVADGSYTNARRDLVTGLGQYCSYCEMPIATSLAVEHMLPKSQFPLLSLQWTNFLLACAMCNSFKREKPRRSGKTYGDPGEEAAIVTAA